MLLSFFVDATIFLEFYYFFFILYGYTVMAKNIGTHGKYDQRRLWKWIFIVTPFDLLFKKITKI